MRACVGGWLRKKRAIGKCVVKNSFGKRELRAVDLRKQLTERRAGDWEPHGNL